MTILRFRYSSSYVTSMINSNVYSIFIENLFICLFNECICTNNPYLKFNLNNVATAKQELTQQKFIMQHIQHYTIDILYSNQKPRTENGMPNTESTSFFAFIFHFGTRFSIIQLDFHIFRTKHISYNSKHSTS